MNQIVFESPEALAVAAAKSFQDLALEAIATRGRFNVALAGGSTPKIIYEQLALLELPWDKIHLFWGDERGVAPNDPNSNYGMVKTALLEKISIPYSNIHRIKTEQNIFIALGEYKLEVEDIQFDLVHLGLGTDGHTASVFPASNLEAQQPVQITFPTPGLEPPVQRISLSLAKINAALVKQFFVTGDSKREILKEISSGEDYPAARVKNAQWWLDNAAKL